MESTGAAATSNHAGPRLRIAGLSPDGRAAAIAQEAGLEWIDLESNDRTHLLDGRLVDFAWDRSGLWIATGDRTIGVENGSEVLSIERAAERLLATGEGVVALGEAAFHLGWDGRVVELPASTVAVAGRGRYAHVAADALIISNAAGASLAQVPIAGYRLVELAPLFSDRLVALWLAGAETDEIWVIQPDGARAQRIELDAIDDWAVAADRGVAVLLRGDRLDELCLRTGRFLRSAPACEAGVCAIEIDAAARSLLLVGDPSARPRSVVHIGLDEALAHCGHSAIASNVPVDRIPTRRLEGVEQHRVDRPIHSLGVGPLIALELETISTERSDSAYSDDLDYLAAVVELAAMRASGDIDANELACEIASRRRGSPALAISALAASFQLTELAIDILGAVVAPAVSARVAELYSALATTGRCDRALLELLLGGEDLRRSVEITTELAELTRVGLIRPRLEPAPALVDRLCGRGLEDAVAVSCPLEELIVPPEVVSSALAAARSSDRRLRLVVRGRRGSGGRTLFAALAAGAGRSIVVIDGVVIDGDATDLRAELDRARIHGAIPCVVDPDKSIAELAAAHAGPIFVRLTGKARPPLDPGYVEIDIPPASESHRIAAWTEAATAAGLALSEPDIERLARRFRVGPGVISRAVASCPITATDELAQALDRQVRQHVEIQLDGLASKVDRLPGWEQLILDEDTERSLRELVGRAEQRRRVLDQWGLDRHLSSARGLTALFAGPPGTGKTLAAGLVARELGLDLYRVDLSQVASKWIGETEKNLGRIFDAVDDGQAVILFDEADSLFSKRGQVKTAVDRHSNMEVNYLLARLDSFEGIAILTTNLAGSMDRAFKRRLGMRVEFPFPDEATRLRLWQAHIPKSMPAAEDLGLERLAVAHPMTGAYIRNCVVRAAYLAASASCALSATFLDEAVELEYLDAGRISTSSRLE